MHGPKYSQNWSQDLTRDEIQAEVQKTLRSCKKGILWYVYEN